MFSAFSLVQGFEFWTFLTPVITLPLTAAGIEAIVDGKKERKSAFVLTGAIFFQALNGFYFLYMIFIFCVVYYFVCCLTQKNSLQKAMKAGGRLLFHGMLGVCMAGIILFPAVIGYLQSARVEGSGGNGLFYEFRTYLDYVKSLFIPRAFESGLGIPIPFSLHFAYLFFLRIRSG